jgi:hypothetical protein
LEGTSFGEKVREAGGGKEKKVGIKKGGLGGLHRSGGNIKEKDLIAEKDLQPEFL